MEISEKNKQKISEQILAHLFARDEEFVKQLLINLKEKGLVIDINKNSKGTPYLKRIRWKLSDKAYSAYKSNQI
ncbi:hypothetical protein HYS72_00750 [Candidatus Pacearchaeota archaeon]|nr:hypothetical protein [Candidatus Pacearchaeota archaeon]